MKFIFPLAVVILLFTAFVGVAYVTAGSKQDGGGKIAGDWVGIVQVSYLGESVPEPKYNRGNAVMMISLHRTVLTFIKQYEGTGTLDNDGKRQNFKLMDVNGSGDGTYAGHMVGDGANAQGDGGPIEFAINGNLLTLQRGTQTMNARFTGILKAGNKKDFDDAVQDLASSYSAK